MGQGAGQILVYAVVLTALGYPLGVYMARVYTDERFLTRSWLGWIERGFCRLVGTNASRGQDWKSYGKTVLVFSLLFSAGPYALPRLPGHLVLKPRPLYNAPPPP